MRVIRLELKPRRIAVFILMVGVRAQHALGELLQVPRVRHANGHGVFLDLGLGGHFHNLAGLNHTGLARRYILLINSSQLFINDLLDVLLAA